MYICKVIGSVVSTQKNEKLMGSSIVMVRVVSISAKKNEITEGNEVFAAVDTVGCGTGKLCVGDEWSQLGLCLQEHEYSRRYGGRWNYRRRTERIKTGTI